MVAAQKDYEQQIAIGDQIHEQKQRAYCFYGLAYVSWERGDSERAKTLLQQSFDLRQKAAEKDLILETRLAQTEIVAAQPSQAALKESLDLAQQFRKEERLDQAVLADAALIRAAVNLQPVDVQISGIAAREIERLLPGIQDYAIRLSARASLAQYNSAIGQNQRALEALRSIIRDAESGGYIVQELERKLMLTKLTLPSKERVQIPEEVYRDASLRGLGRIAREAMALIHKPTNSVALSTQR